MCIRDSIAPPTDAESIAAVHAPAMRDKGTVDVDPDRRDGLRLSSPSTPGGFDDDDARAADAARRDRTRRVRSTPAPLSGLPGAAVIEHPPDAVVISRRVRVCHKFCGTV